MAGVAVAGRTIRGDNTEAIGAAGTRRPEPPVVDRTANAVLLFSVICRFIVVDLRKGICFIAE